MINAERVMTNVTNNVMANVTDNVTERATDKVMDKVMERALWLFTHPRWTLSSIKKRITKAYLEPFLLNVLQQGELPRHVGYIMDGNRRFARKNIMAHRSGHMEGFKALESVRCHTHTLFEM